MSKRSKQAQNPARLLLATLQTAKNQPLEAAERSQVDEFEEMTMSCGGTAEKSGK
jgi:hypothetical protein